MLFYNGDDKMCASITAKDHYVGKLWPANLKAIFCRNESFMCLLLSPTVQSKYLKHFAGIGSHMMQLRSPKICKSVMMKFR